jgi:L-ribulose-5-phosphate 3-epimerase
VADALSLDMHPPAPLTSRRQFLRHASLAAATLAAPAALHADPKIPDALAGRIYKTLKIGMIKGGDLTERFKTAKAAGFMGVEMGFPGDNVEDTKKAIAESGLTVDGSVCGQHWQIRHTSADAETRAKALENLKQALRDTKSGAARWRTSPKRCRLPPNWVCRS